MLNVAVTFITYSLTGHELSPSIIFPALQYFGLIACESGNVRCIRSRNLLIPGQLHFDVFPYNCRT